MSETIYNRVYSPSTFGSKTAKASFTKINCSNKDNCSLYKKGECALLRLNVFSSENCPYGSMKEETGYTPRARNYWSWISSKQDGMVPNQVSKSPATKMALVGEYVYFPYSLYADYEQNTLAKKVQRRFLKKEEFTKSFMIAMLTRVPRTLLDNQAITSYQKEEVPVMIQHLKEEFPDLYQEVIEERPDLAEKTPVSRVGRKALLKTLKPNVGVFAKDKKDHEKWVWDGEYLSSSNSKVLFSIIRGEETIIRIKPSDSCAIEITDDGQYAEGSTVLVD